MTQYIVFEDPGRSKLLVDCLRAAGFHVELTGREAEILKGSGRYVPLNKALLENPTQAMLCYNTGGADRTYPGHWSPLFSSVRKQEDGNSVSDGPERLDRRSTPEEAMGELQDSIVPQAASQVQSEQQISESGSEVVRLQAELVRRDVELAELQRQLATTRAYVGIIS